jgi:hypothetical protein
MGLGRPHQAGPAAPVGLAAPAEPAAPARQAVLAGPAVLGGSVVPSPCGMLVPNFRKKFTYP